MKTFPRPALRIAFLLGLLSLNFPVPGIAFPPLVGCDFAQGFESSAADTWSFSVTPISYNTETTGDVQEVNGDEDVWGVIKEFTGDIDSPSEGAFFWGMQDLENSAGGAISTMC